MDIGGGSQAWLKIGVRFAENINRIRDVHPQEVMAMLATVQGMGVALPNLAFSLILRSVQQAPSAPKAPSHTSGTQAPTTPLADSHPHVDVKA